MYFPNRYQDHNLALERFVTTFNKSIPHKNRFIIKMFIEQIENYRDDGHIEIKNDINLKYDFEKRFNYYPSYGKFKFDNLGQFERKIMKKEILLSIQSSTDETGFVFAFHKDFQREPKRYIASKTRYSHESNAKRFTKCFHEIAYANMSIFIDMLMSCHSHNDFCYEGCKKYKNNND